jgi:very-short-patch-repair endonuclease
MARKLRRSATDAETILWRAQREAFPEMRFRRQHPIGRHIVDFACPARKLAVELDGGHHAEQHAGYANRTIEIQRRGYWVVRF